MRKLILLFITLTPLIFSCSRSHVLEHAWELIQDHPETVYEMLDTLSLSSWSSEKEKAEYALLKTMAMDKMFIDVENDSLIQVACKYYDRGGAPERKMLANYYMGVVQDNAKNYPSAIVHLSKAEDLAEKLNDHMNLGLILSAKRFVFSSEYNHEEALICFAKTTISKTNIMKTQLIATIFALAALPMQAPNAQADDGIIEIIIKPSPGSRPNRAPARIPIQGNVDTIVENGGEEYSYNHNVSMIYDFKSNE